MAEKDFQRWHEEKALINRDESHKFFAEREIWICAIGANVGFEQDGKGSKFLRPVLIFKKFNKDIFWGIPLSHTRKVNKFYFDLGEGMKSAAILSQIRLFDAKRLVYKKQSLDLEIFNRVKTAFIDLVNE